jgi:hypothetical protein
MQHLVDPAFLPAPDQRRRELELTVEQGIGSLIATLVGVLERGMRECRNGGLTSATKHRAADLIALLVPLRRHGSDFDQLARKYGLAVLREHCKVNLIELDDAYLAELIDITLGLMTVISKQAAN